MIFESLWPLFLLAAIPVIIILYLLKPKGEDYRISSNLLWQKILKNQRSKTFFEKFIHNILMYIQILIVVLLILALMSPFVNMKGQGGGHKIILIDTSASMQHVGESGKTRLEETKDIVSEYIRKATGTSFSLLTVDEIGVDLHAIDLDDMDSLLQVLDGLSAKDCGGKITQAQSILDTLSTQTTDFAPELMVYTDGNGAEEFEQLRFNGKKELYVMGGPVSNVANEYTVYTLRDDGLYDIMVSLMNYSENGVSLDISLSDENGMIALLSKQIGAGERSFCLFEGIVWNGESLESKLSAISFLNEDTDSLEADNVSHTVKTDSRIIKGLLVGEGNTFVEKAYSAVVGDGIAKAETDSVTHGNDYNLIIYDNMQIPSVTDVNRLVFGDGQGKSVEIIENVVLSMKDCDLTAGLSDFHIGVNKAYCFVLPEGAKSFLEYEGKCVGYYREVHGIKEIVVGFDVRESDFPLRAEFPVFLANAMIYLTNTSWLVTNEYFAGEKLALQPWAEPELEQEEYVLAKEGIYGIGNDSYEELYVVRFQTGTESDGQTAADDVIGNNTLRMQKVKHTLRNVLLVLVLVLLVVEWILYIRQMRYKGKFYYIVRAVVLVCVLLALLGVKVSFGKGRAATVFLVDVSSSNAENLEYAKEYLKETIENMPKGNSYGVITFGKEAQVEQFITEERYFGGLMTTSDGTATNFEEAVSKALTMIPADMSGRLVVLTDGKETRGDIHRMAHALVAGQTQFYTIMYEDAVKEDAYIEKVTLPSYLHPGNKYAINVVVESNYDTEAEIIVYNGSIPVASSAVLLNKGSNHFVFNGQVDADASGDSMENLRVVVNAKGDMCNENDYYSAYSVVEAAPKVLVISGKNVNASAYSTILTAAGCDYSVVSALNAPKDIDEMLSYKTIILVDTYIDDLPIGFLNNLESYVKDYGCGFVCCGGTDSYALGGYRDTVLETVLPVDMELRNMNEMPSMAMVMVIDHSGSMSSVAGGSTASNLDVAIKAATVAVDNLRNSDYVGALTFDDSYTWQVEMVQASDKEAIKEEIQKIAEGGGTTIKPALQEACDVIAKSNASVKHVVLLTDGMGETTNFTDVINNYNNSGITLSTVAVGDGSDTRLLKQLAQDCGGRYYYSDLASDIPKIFAQEVFLGGDSFIQNGEFPLAVRTNHELTAGLFQEGWPLLLGYVSASPKTTSNVIVAASEKEDPILTVWQYGLGRTVAWNSQVTGQWDGMFAGKDDYVQLWKRIVDYSTGNIDMGADKVNIVTISDTTELSYEAQEYTDTTEILATVITPEGESVEVSLSATAPGKFETDISTWQTGVYHFNIRRMESGEMQSYMTTATSVQFSDEYKFDVSAASYLSFVEKNGKLLTEEENIWKEQVIEKRDKRTLTNFLICLSILLFLADVAMRRFQYEPRWKGVSQKIHNISEETVLDISSGEIEKTKDETQNQKVKKVKKKKAQEQTLDTSQLLKKKEERNL